MQTNIPEGKDRELWKLAHQRASFRSHFITYILVNAFLWAIWFFTAKDDHLGIPWPIWPTIGWGIGIALQYVKAFVHPQVNAVEKEYEKLKNKS